MNGIIQWIRKIFSLTNKTFDIPMSFDMNNESKRMELAQRIYDFYSGNIEAIISRLEDTLLTTFRPDEVEEMQKWYIPISKKIIKKSCLVYKGEVTRSFTRESATEKLTEILS